MEGRRNNPFEKKRVTPQDLLKRIEPGSSIFIGTGAAEPRTLVKFLMSSDLRNLQDLELVQLVSFGDAISLQNLRSQKYRLKTFFSGWVAFDAVTSGLVDLIPSKFSKIPRLAEQGSIRIDAAFIQVTPPDHSGYCSLGIAVDVARQVMEKADIVVGEISDQIPCTLGDTFVHVDDFDFFVTSTQKPIYFARWPFDETFDKVAANVASVIEDGSCLAFSIGPLFEALGRHLVHKKNLGIHTSIFTDSLMDLVSSGAVTNRYKGIFRGKSLTSYALGTPDLFRWLNWNPLVEFQGIDKISAPENMGRNDNFVAILPARKVDLTGRVAFPLGKGNVTADLGDAYDLFSGAAISKNGKSIVALPSRNLEGQSNIRISIEEFPNQFADRESVDMIITEYGVAYLSGRTIRERAQALIDIAHPDDRVELVKQAKEKNLLYQDQIYIAEAGKMYPENIKCTQTFKDGLEVRFRAMKPSDEEEMRRLFYRFSDKAVYYRYFSPIKTMPHSKMQQYVNIDYNKTLSIVALVGDPSSGQIIAEGRYAVGKNPLYADVAFVVDEAYQGKGIATHLFKKLIHIAQKRGFKGLTADVLATNKSMMKVFEKSPYPVEARIESGVYEIVINFNDAPSERSQGIKYVK